MSGLRAMIGPIETAVSGRGRSARRAALVVARGVCQAAPAIGFATGIAATSLAALSTIAVLYTGVLGSIVGIAIRDVLSRPPLL